RHSDSVMAGINILDRKFAFLSRVLAGKNAPRQKRRSVILEIVSSRGCRKLFKPDFAFLAASVRQALYHDAAADRTWRQKFQIEAGHIFLLQSNSARRRSQVSLFVGCPGGEEEFAVGQSLKRKPSGPARSNITRPGGGLRPNIVKRNGNNSRRFGRRRADH